MSADILILGLAGVMVVAILIFALTADSDTNGDRRSDNGNPDVRHRNRSGRSRTNAIR